MPRPILIAVGLAMILGAFIGFGWMLKRSLRSSDDPARLLFKWILTGLLAGFLIFTALGVGPDSVGAVAIPFVALAAGIALTFIWAPSLGAMLAKPLTSMFDGGNEEPDAKPLYSIAESRRMQGKYTEAIREIQNQLARFPTDVIGQLMIAEIQAVNLNDLAAADLAIQRLCHQPGHAPKNIAYALTQLADWHLKYAQDTEAARQALEKIVERFPATDLGQAAAQRLAHLGTTAQQVAALDRTVIPLPEGVPYAAWKEHLEKVAPPAADPDEAAGQLINHLEQHPLDAETRERLAIIYATQSQRLDLATIELEQMIRHPNQPPRQLVHWLNLLADFQITPGNDAGAAAQTLQRIIDLFPTQAAADLARQRMSRLKLELRKNEKSQVVKLGSYDPYPGKRKED